LCAFFVGHYHGTCARSSEAAQATKDSANEVEKMKSFIASWSKKGSTKVDPVDKKTGEPGDSDLDRDSDDQDALM
jgi:hypothetical protein